MRFLYDAITSHLKNAWSFYLNNCVTPSPKNAKVQSLIEISPFVLEEKIDTNIFFLLCNCHVPKDCFKLAQWF